MGKTSNDFGIWKNTTDWVEEGLFENTGNSLGVGSSARKIKNPFKWILVHFLGFVGHENVKNW